MCRLLGVVAERPAPLSELLADELDPFIELACEHSDGWGISYLGPDRLIVTVKEPVSALKSTVLKPLTARIVTSAAIVHLRMGSPGSAVSPANTHPFGDASCAFAHNGQFTPPGALDPTLGEDLAQAQGDTDSERYYLAVRRRMNAGTGPAAAIAAAATDIRTLATGWVSTNCLLLTPDALYAHADHSLDSEVIRRRGPDFFDLRTMTAPGRLLVASTGWPQPPGQWCRLPDQQVFEISPDLALTVHDEFALDRQAPGTRP
jgi:predicted glutamine amidotransferase